MPACHASDSRCDRALTIALLHGPPNGLASHHTIHRRGCNTLTVEDRLRTLADALPDGASVTLPVSLIRSWLIQSGSADSERAVDMTVAEVASLLSRSPQTIRTWIRQGDLDAYRLRGREYRVTRVALAAFLAHQQDRAAPQSSLRSSGGRSASLGSWRSARR